MKIYGLNSLTKVFTVLLSSFVIISCEDKTPGIPPAVGEISHTIGGIVSDIRGTSIFKDITVELESDGGIALQTKTDTLGAYTFSGLKTPGIYKLKFIGGEGYEDVEESVLLENEGNTVQCKYVDVQLPVVYSETVKPEEETSIEIRSTYKSVSDVFLSFPVGAVDAESGIRIVQLPYVNVPVETDGKVVEAREVPPFFILKILPSSGSSELKQPMTLTIGTIIKNETYLKFLSLYKLENDQWKKQDAEVIFNADENRYEVSMATFGTYMLAPQVNVSIMKSTKAVPTVNNGIFYNDSDDPMKINKIRYKRYSGWEFVETPSNAARSAGIKDRNNAGTVLTQLIVSSLRCGEKYSTWHEFYLTDYTLPYGTRLTMAGTQEYENLVYSFTLNEGGTDKVVNLEMNRYGNCKFVMSTSN